MSPLLSVENLEVSFPTERGRVSAVRGLTWSIEPGEVLGIVGESGSGKSVSSMAIMGLLPAHARVSGSIRFDGAEIIGRPDAELSKIRGRRIAMVFQDPLSALTPVYRVGDQVAEAVLVHGGGRVTKAQAAARAVELLDLVGIPHAADRARAFPHEFSGGMRQRVVIAMAIANDPDLIIADEPTTALDVTVQAQVLDVLRTAKELTGAAIALITHDLGVVAGFADRIHVMYAGRTVEAGPVDEIFYRPRMPYTVGLLGSLPRIDRSSREPLVPIEGAPPSLIDLAPGCPFSPRCPMRIDVCGEVEPALEPTDGAAHSAACHRHAEIGSVSPAEVFDVSTAAPDPEPGETVLRVDGLVRHYPVTAGTVFRRQVGTVRAVDGISFDIRSGETLALVGESGCGKTTTLMEILELAAPPSGRIEVLGTDVSTLDKAARRQLRRDIQVVFQDPIASLDPRMPVHDILTEPLTAQGVSRADAAARVPELLRLVGLEPGHAARYPGDFSGGQRQRIGIARALACEPKVLVLDEPVSALDVSIRAGVVNLLDELRRTLGLAYLFVAHDLSVVRHIADRVAVMYLGTIVEIGDVDEVFSRPAHPYTRALLSAIPVPDPAAERARERVLLVGDQPSATALPAGCRFRPRCPRYAELDPEARAICEQQEPPREPVPGTVAHEAACHHAYVPVPSKSL